MPVEVAQSFSMALMAARCACPASAADIPGLLVHSKVGKILTAIRDNENRTMALGYSPAAYKVFAFILSGAICGFSVSTTTRSVGGTSSGRCGENRLFPYSTWTTKKYSPSPLAV